MTKYILLALLALIIGFAIWFNGLTGPQKLNFADKAYLIGESQFAYTQKNIAFGDDEKQKLDVYWPKQTGEDSQAQDSPSPVIIFYHGGSWRDGEREGYAFLGRALAEHGYVSVIADYRKTPQVVFPGFVEDAASAFVWTEKNIARYGGDANTIFIMGHSAGAHLMMLIGLDPKYLNAAGSDPARIKGIIGLAGPYDFLPFTGDAAKEALGQWPQLEETQPITFARGDAAPMLLLTGEDDTTVLPRNGQRLEAAIRDVNGAVEIKEYPNVDHTGIIMAYARPFRGYANALQDSIAFIEKHR